MGKAASAGMPYSDSTNSLIANIKSGYITVL
jgi:hypothetical protein